MILLVKAIDSGAAIISATLFAQLVLSAKCPPTDLVHIIEADVRRSLGLSGATVARPYAEAQIGGMCGWVGCLRYVIKHPRLALSALQREHRGRTTFFFGSGDC